MCVSVCLSLIPREGAAISGQAEMPSHALATTPALQLQQQPLWGQPNGRPTSWAILDTVLSPTPSEREAEQRGGREGDGAGPRWVSSVGVEAPHANQLPRRRRAPGPAPGKGGRRQAK